MSEEILETAVSILVTEGYESLTIQRLAEELDMTGAGVYYHFESKDELLVAIVDYLKEELTTELSSVEGPPDERLATMVQEMFAAAEAVQQMEMLPPSSQLLLSTTDSNEMLRQSLLELTEACVGQFTETIREGVESGVFETEHPEQTARLLLAIIDGAERRAVFGKSSEPLVQGTVRYILTDLYVDGPPELEIEQ
ncbi:TetR/AcrR family transcriptional regulator [Halovenus rubra]|uniref:TetR/AcrR family transcriptional regulator n=2 Tax=Halovenus rubra TaxID=869890 RepID=A0ABD5X884_9EURY|nr:TetR/AcrR family transcriptional regulator [Halovenus rubra]